MPDKPHVIYSWASGVLREQVKTGVIEDISDALNANGWKDRFNASALNLHAVDGRTYGVPMLTSQVVFFYSKDLFAKAGVDGNAIKSWDKLLGAVNTLQAAGITPIVAGGGECWPPHFYWSHLAIRLGGKPAFDAVMAGLGKGFASETFVGAGELSTQLVDLTLQASASPAFTAACATLFATASTTSSRPAANGLPTPAASSISASTSAATTTR